MHDLILDENVYILALEAECTLQNEHLRWARIVSLVQEHHRWVVSNEILTAYRRQFSVIGCRSATTSQLKKSLNEVLFDSRHSLYLNDPPHIPGNYHHKDRHVVAAAAYVVNAYLLTTDQRLTTALHRDRIPEERGFQVVELSGAENLLLSSNGE